MSAILLRLLSALWSTVNAGMRLAARRGWVGSRKLPARVLSVGNLQVGGAGKTPLVALIAQEAIARGQRVCILSRGYGGIWEANGGVIAPGKEPAHPALCGDEPALLHELAPEAWIGVGRDRVQQFEAVLAQAVTPMDSVILDDGFQHWRIRKDVEILAVTSQSRGERLYREWEGAARWADLRVWTKGELPPRGWGEGLSACEDVRVRMRPRVRIGELLTSKKFWLVTGLADGHSARRSIEAENFEVVRHLSFPDHARYASPVVKQIMEDAWEAGAVVAVTGKDWVKWKDLGLDESRIVVLEPELEMLEGREKWLKTLWGVSS